jgi:ATP adenylyltransferase
MSRNHCRPLLVFRASFHDCPANANGSFHQSEERLTENAACSFLRKRQVRYPLPIMSRRTAFARGSLAGRIAAVSAAALASGALLPIATGFEFVQDGGVRFFVRVLASLQRKSDQRAAEQRAAAAGRPFNPFLPYEQALFVAAVSATHVAILNKFNVVDRHLLVVTREFEEQRALLTLRDFEAWWRCMGEYASLGFYNGGAEAGASQAHKHLQLVPLPLAPQGPPVPIEPLLAGVHGDVGAGTIPGFDFLHAFARLGPSRDESSAARQAFEWYASLLEQVGLRRPTGRGTDLQSGPYCLLATREWLLLVPRSREYFGPISINALGFAGALLVRNEEQLRALQAAGPFAALRETALPAREARTGVEA